MIVPTRDGALEVGIMLLPEEVARRNCENSEERAIIMHCFDRVVEGQSFTRKQIMIQRGLWALRNDWWETVQQAVPRGAEFLKEISYPLVATPLTTEVE